MFNQIIDPAQTRFATTASYVRALRARLGAKWSVVVLTLPLVAFGTLHFGLRAGMVVLLSVLLCMTASILPRRLAGQPYRLFNPGTILTGILLGLTLSANTPIYMIVVGALVAEMVAKAPFPWLNRPLFNPAALGRGAVAILEELDPYPLTDAMNSASPLMLVAGGHAPPAFLDLLLGFSNGAIGETSRLLLLVVGSLMLLFVVHKRQAPLGLVLSVPLWVALMPATPEIQGHAPWALNPFIYLFGGSTLLMTFFFSTDPMTTPRTRLGGWIFGAGVGLIGVTGRLYTSIPGCEMWGVLIMNGLTPAIDHMVERARGLLANKPGELAGPATSFYANPPERAQPVIASGLHDPIAAMRAGLPTGAFPVLLNTLKTSSSAAVVEEVATSGLGGCGGAHFPVAAKWRSAKQHLPPRVLVINAQEGEEESFKDHYLLAHDPHLIIEGAALAAYAIAAGEVYVVVAPEADAELVGLERAIEELHQACGDALPIEFKLVKGSGLYVCGEETALLEFLESRRGEPRQRPPFPSEKGLFGRPTVVHNVETVSWLPLLLNGGGQAFREGGPLKLVSVSGAVAHPGVYAVALGTPLGHIVEMAGGIAPGKELQAVGVGGPSGGFLPPAMLYIPLDDAALAQAGAQLGTAALRVVDKRECLVQASLGSIRFFKNESCGRCTPCRVGTGVLQSLTEDLARGAQGKELLHKLEEVSGALKSGSFCGLGRAAPNRLNSVKRYWPELIAAHLDGGKGCPVCDRSNQ